MRIEVNYKTLATFDDNFSSLSKKMDRISSKVKSLSSSLDWEVASQENIKSDLSKVTSNMVNQSKSLGNMSKFITSTSKKYKAMDKAMDKLAPKDKVSFMTASLKKMSDYFQKALKLTKKGLKFTLETLIDNSADFAVFAIVASKKFKGINNKFVKFMSGEYDYAIFKNKLSTINKLSSYIDDRTDKVKNWLKNSSINKWIESPGKGKLIKKTTNLIIKKATDFKGLARNFLPKTLTFGFSIARDTIGILKNDTYNAYTKTKKILSNAAYTVVEAGIVTVAADLVVAGGIALAAGLGVTAAAPVAVVIGATLAVSIGLSYALNKTKVKENAVNKIEKYYDKVFKREKRPNLKNNVSEKMRNTQAINENLNEMKKYQLNITENVKPTVNELIQQSPANQAAEMKRVQTSINHAESNMNNIIKSTEAKLASEFEKVKQEQRNPITKLKEITIKTNSNQFSQALAN